MKYFSTKDKKRSVTFRTAVMKGLAENGGLYMPELIPQFSHSWIESMKNMSFHELALKIAEKYCTPDISPEKLQEIIERALTFPSPLVKIKPGVMILELFHGPTLAFKDFGARFMARTLEYFVQFLDKELTILVATSGDTGSAVGSGFQGIEGIRVFLLYPSGKVSHIQEQQLTTIGGNVQALEIKGNFDDCQSLVKQAFQDQVLAEKFCLTSANSINISRLIPQMFYYFDAFRNLDAMKKPVIFSVPSGNLGNITAGLLAMKMGLPVEKIIGATNSNDVFTSFIQTGKFSRRKAIQTYSNAMDVGNPSNLVRIRTLYKNNIGKIREDILSASFSDDETLQIIESFYKETGYVLDPHGAVGYLALEYFIKKMSDDFNGIVLETAHPAKFKSTVEKAIKRHLSVPRTLANSLSLPKQSIILSSRYDEFREYLFRSCD